MNFFKIYDANNKKDIDKLNKWFKDKYGEMVDWNRSPIIKNNKILYEFNTFISKKGIEDFPKYMVDGMYVEILNFEKFIEMVSRKSIGSFSNKYFKDEKERRRFAERIMMANFPLPKEFEYDVLGEKKKITLSEIRKDLDKRNPYWYQHILDNNVFYRHSTLEENRVSLEGYFKDMGIYTAHKGVMDRGMEDVFEDEEISYFHKDFIDWFLNKNNITEQQICCEHDRTDSWTVDGYWVNCLDKCVKCGLEEDNDLEYCSEKIEDLYEAWCAGRGIDADDK